MNSACLFLVGRQFAGRPVLNIVAAARALARGHASYALALRSQAPQGEMATRVTQRRIARADSLAVFWSAVGLHFGVLDLIEEHDEEFPASLAHTLRRYTGRQMHDIYDPPLLSNHGFDPIYLLPPPEHLRTALPATLLEVFGARLNEKNSTKNGTNRERSLALFAHRWAAVGTGVPRQLCDRAPSLRGQPA